MIHRSTNPLAYVEIFGFRRNIPERRHHISTHTVSNYDYYDVYVYTVITFRHTMKYIVQIFRFVMNEKTSMDDY